MNQMSFQPNNFQARAQSAGQSNKYQPAGFVQSQYQGQLRQSRIAQSQQQQPVLSRLGSTAGQSNSQYQPVISHAGGYQASQQSFGGQQFSAQSMSSSAGAQSQQQQPVLSRLGSTAGQSNSQYQPVISHAGGYQASQQSFGGQQFAGQSMNSFAAAQSQQQQPVLSRLGSTAEQSNQSQYQPVISHTGGYQASNANVSAQSNFGAQASFQSAQASQNPVYQATNARSQEGPVIAQLGYTNAQNAQAGMNSANRF